MQSLCTHQYKRMCQQSGTMDHASLYIYIYPGSSGIGRRTSSHTLACDTRLSHDSRQTAIAFPRCRSWPPLARGQRTDSAEGAGRSAPAFRHSRPRPSAHSARLCAARAGHSRHRQSLGSRFPHCSSSASRGSTGAGGAGATGDAGGSGSARERGTLSRENTAKRLLLCITPHDITRGRACGCFSGGARDRDRGGRALPHDQRPFVSAAGAVRARCGGRIRNAGGMARHSGPLVCGCGCAFRKSRGSPKTRSST